LLEIRSSERGATLAVTAVSILAVMCTFAVVLDLGVLRSAHTQAQAAADASALSGASAYLNFTSPSDPATLNAVHARARSLASQYFIQDFQVDTLTEVLVEPFPLVWQVRVTVRRQFVPMWFARLFGITGRPVSAVAVAEAAPAGAASCLKPFAIPDIGYTQNDLGRLDTLKAGNVNDPGGSGVANFFFPIRLPPEPGIVETCPLAGEPWDNNQGVQWNGFHNQQRPPNPSNPNGRTDNGAVDACTRLGGTTGSGSCWYRANICNQNCQELSIGPTYQVETGNIAGPSAQGANVLLALDPHLAWDPWGGPNGNGGLVRNGTPVDPTTQGVSPRVIKVALYDTTTFTHPSDAASGIQFTGFAYWMVEWKNQTQWTFYDPDDQNEALIGRFLFYAPGSGGGPQTGQFTRYLRLIK
jgi:hypothetical protein